MEFIIVAVLLALGFFIGRSAESAHFRSLQTREQELLDLPAVPSKTLLPDGEVVSVALVSGECAISDDYFKSFIASLKSLIGGRLTTYESLVDRARREAIVRMKSEARKLGASMVTNVRIETGRINAETSGKKKGVTSVDALAYGTAIIVRKSDSQI